MAILEAQFPPRVSLGFKSTVSFDTTINESRAGLERRNANRSQPRRVFEAQKEHLTVADYLAARNFFMAVLGAWQGFRFKDWTDYQSDTAQTIGTGDGATLGPFQLIKVYTVSSPLTSYQRTITKPVSGTLLVYVDGVLKTEGANPGGDYTVSYSTGVITFNAGKAPGNTLAVTATFEFDVPVRFQEDGLGVTVPFRYDRFNLGELAFVEVLDE